MPLYHLSLSATNGKISDPGGFTYQERMVHKSNVVMWVMELWNVMPDYVEGKESPIWNSPEIDD